MTKKRRKDHTYVVKNIDVYKQTTKDYQYACVTKERLVSGKLAKEQLKLSLGRDPVGARLSSSWAPSLVVRSV